MSDMNEQGQTSERGTGETQRPSAFCQHCGKPLDQQSKRVVGEAVYCEPCLAARLTGSPAGAGTGPQAAGYGQTYTGGAWAGAPVATGQPNPGLAALLGLIPGVGAMYNEQYAKGIVHLVIFALLVSFSHVTGIFILFVFGWLAYMSIEAHHTAKARRDGTPLPNPFGFNDIGERFGFGRAWPGTPDVAAVARDAAQAAATSFGSMHTSFAQGYATTPGTYSGPYAGPYPGPNPVSAPMPEAATPPPGAPGSDPPPVASAGWGAPVDAYPAATGVASAVPGAYTAASWGAASGYQQAYAQGYAPAHPYQYGTQAPYGARFVAPAGAAAPLPPMPPMTSAPHRFPVGAIWLIGLGTFFLLGTTGIFRHVSAGLFIGALLIGFAVWLFIRLMTGTGQGLADDGTPGYRLRLLRALKPSVWLMLFGVLSLLNDLHWLNWEYSWPWIIILAGVMMLLNRAAYNSAAAAMYVPGASATSSAAVSNSAVPSPEPTEPDTK